MDGICGFGDAADGRNEVSDSGELLAFTRFGASPDRRRRTILFVSVHIRPGGRRVRAPRGERGGRRVGACEGGLAAETQGHLCQVPKSRSFRLTLSQVQGSGGNGVGSLLQMRRRGAPGA